MNAEFYDLIILQENYILLRKSKLIIHEGKSNQLNLKLIIELFQLIRIFASLMVDLRNLKQKVYMELSFNNHPI